MDAFAKMAGPPGFFKPNRPHQNEAKKRRPHRRQMQDGVRTAALRAFTAAQLYKEGTFPAIAKAAQACGSTGHYVRAAKVILDAENTEVQHDVLAGRLPLLVAASQLRRLADLVKAYRAISSADLPRFGKTVGVADLFDHAIAPAL
jgi:hypothetical protein